MPANDSYWRSLKKMHVVFVVSAIGLLGVTLWMMGKDHAGEWRKYQTTFDRIEDLRLKKQIDADTTIAYTEKLADLNGKLEAANAKYEQDKGDIESEIAKAQLDVDIASRELRTKRAYRDKARADFDLAVRDEKSEEAKRLKEAFDVEQIKVDEQELVVQQLTTQLNQLKQQQQDMKDRVTAIQAEIAATTKEVDRLEKTKAKIAPEGGLAFYKRKIMQWPIIDGFNSPHKIDQVWLPDLKITLGMASTARFDRCKTCHLGIDRVEAGNVPSFPFDASLPSADHPTEAEVKKWVDANKYPHPYATHPNPDLYLSSTSPHPTQNFGCTICHDGQGSGTSFDNAAHTPNDPYEHELWTEEFHYHPNHFWEYPMQPDRFRESTCLRCHHQVVELGTSPKFGNSAPHVVKGFDTIQQFGCFGCHEIHGQDGKKSLGPDLRLEPNHYAVAQAIAAAAAKVKSESEAAADNLKDITRLADQVASAPDDTPSQRMALQQLVLADKGVEKPLFNSRIHALADELKDVENPGKYRKVGPSLRHVKQKTTGGWLEYWTNKPQDFRPSTRMPQFFHLTNQEDEMADAYQPIQVAAIGHYLLDKSQTVDLLTPPEGYKPDADRGEKFFAEKGCLACHTHEKFPKAKMDFGPNLDKVYAKLKPGAEGFTWLYSWIRDPHRYHARTKMPNLFIEADPPKAGEEPVDPAADIAAFLLKPREESPVSYPMLELKNYDVVLTEVGDNRNAVTAVVQEATGLNVGEINPLLDSVPSDIRMGLPKEAAEQLKTQLKNAGGEAKLSNDLDRLVDMFVKQFLTNAQMKELEASRNFLAAANMQVQQVKGDEIELVHDGPGAPSEAEWQSMKLNYVGRRTISQYGCYGCHDIPGYEASKPIGTTLQDWGRKDTSRLAFEHINEFLQHHSTPGSDTPLTEQVDQAMKRANADEFKTEAEAEEGLTKAFYYDSILHHGRPGFLWQKLRQPRSFDYEKIETKRYDERLRMPKFPFSSEQVEAVATFVLGLTAEPPAPKYLFAPKGPALARYEGEALLHKYNCTSCHMVELPEVLQVVKPRQPKEDTISWLVENREELANGSLPRADYETYYRQLDSQLQKYAGVNVQKLAEKANAESKPEAYLNKWFDQHPKTLSATYADYSNIGMTRDQIIQWFVENRDGLLEGSASDYPEDITKIQELCELFNLGTDVRGIAKLADVTEDGTGRKLAPAESRQRYEGNLKSWFDTHPETLLVDVDTLKNPKLGKLPAGVRALFKVKPPVSGETNRLSESGDPVLKFHGMGLYIEELEGYSYDLWDTLSVGGRIMLPTSKMLFSPEEVVEMNPGRGGVFTEWLVERLSGGQFDKISKARQSSPPPLVLEGYKVQTPWLYHFLKNPERIRHETVLRMPRFNMSDAEARALANYFAAVEDAEYPYQDIPQRKPGYIAAENRAYHEEFPEDAKEQPEYLDRAWKMLGKYAACRQCHSVAGDEFKVLDPKQVTHGPDLNTRVASRFRPEFLDAWLQSPQWILPYTAMAGPTSAPLDGYFDKNPDAQVQALRDAMLNFNQLLESQGKIEPPPPSAIPPVAGQE